MFVEKIQAGDIRGSGISDIVLHLLENTDGTFFLSVVQAKEVIDKLQSVLSEIESNPVVTPPDLTAQSHHT